MITFPFPQQPNFSNFCPTGGNLTLTTLSACDIFLRFPKKQNLMLHAKSCFLGKIRKILHLLKILPRVLNVNFQSKLVGFKYTCMIIIQPQENKSIFVLETNGLPINVSDIQPNLDKEIDDLIKHTQQYPFLIVQEPLQLLDLPKHYIAIRGITQINIFLISP